MEKKLAAVLPNKGTAAYTAQLMTTINDEFHGMFDHSEHYIHGARFRSKMLDLDDPDAPGRNMWQWYEDHCNKHCMFTSPDLTDSIYVLSDGIFTMLEKQNMLFALKLLLRFTIPNTEGAPSASSSPPLIVMKLNAPNK
eukprot:8688952-Karenia_brevis.AAC.1